MKKLRLTTLLVFLYFTCSLYGQSVVNSLHNLSVSGPGTVKASSESEVCIFCHTTHSTNPMGPLWNREDPGSHYILYDNTISNTFQSAPGQPDGASLLCLSCHDGTIALGNVLSRSSSIDFSGGYTTLTGVNSLTTDLSDDHPVSFIFNATIATSDGQLSYPPSHPAKLDNNGKVQCTSCHDPHNSMNQSFLLATTQFSELCFSCHNREYWTTSSHQSSTATWNSAGLNPWAHLENPYTTVAENACENCHDLHSASGKTRLMKSGLEENNCLDCHNGNVAATNIELELNKAYRHNVYAYNQIHTPLENASPNEMHVECVDCHNPHAVNNTTANAPLANGWLDGVRGIDQGGNAVSIIQFEYELCYRCHSDNPAVTNTTARQIVQFNVRLEFDVNNPSYHPVAGQGKNLNVPSLILPLNTSSIVYCTDCHASNGTNVPAGPHGSIYPSILKYRYETTDYTVESYSNYELCYSCHDRTSILGNISFPYHNRHITDLQTPCNVCHDPHGISISQGNTTNNSFLINFDITIVSASGMNEIQFVDDGVNKYCLLRCHGRGHGPGMSY